MRALPVGAVLAVILFAACGAASPSPMGSPSAIPSVPTTTVELRRTPADLGCDSIGWDNPYTTLTVRVDPAAPDPVTAVSDTGVRLLTSWPEGFTLQLTPARVVRDAAGREIARDAQVLLIEPESALLVGGYATCLTASDLSVLPDLDSGGTGDPDTGDIATGDAGPVDPLAIDSVATVVTDDLRVRSRPEVSDASRRLTPLLRPGTSVFVVDGPVAGSGYDWYLVAPFDAHSGLDAATQYGAWPFGWVAAAGKDGEAWLAPSADPCPLLPSTYRALAAIPSLLGLACFGDTTITVSAELMRPEATCGADIGWSVDPAWLGSTCSHPEFMFGDHADGWMFSEAVLDPSFDATGLDPGFEPATAVAVSVTGAFDHPTARQCTIVVYEASTEPEIGPEEAVLRCRSQFVLTDIRTAQ